MPLISIIITVCNIADHISDCLNSCINQTFSDIEIIVVNDGSTDNSLEVIEEISRADRRISIINKSNEGVLLARKSGIERARGEFVFQLDGDDYIEKDAIESLYNVLIEQKADITIGAYSIDKRNHRQPVLYPGEGIWSSEEYTNYIIDNHSFSIWGKLIRKELYKDINYIHTNIGDDIIIILQIMDKCPKIWVVNKQLYHYVYRHNSIMNADYLRDRADQELQCAIAISELLCIIRLNELHSVKLTSISINKICFFLSTYGEFGKRKAWIRNYIMNCFIKNKKNRFYMWKENKRIYIQILISYYLSPKISRLLSGIRHSFR